MSSLTPTPHDHMVALLASKPTPQVLQVHPAASKDNYQPRVFNRKNPNRILTPYTDATNINQPFALRAFAYSLFASPQSPVTLDFDPPKDASQGATPELIRLTTKAVLKWFIKLLKQYKIPFKVIGTARGGLHVFPLVDLSTSDLRDKLSSKLSQHVLEKILTESENPQLTPDQIKDAIYSGAEMELKLTNPKASSYVVGAGSLINPLLLNSQKKTQYQNKVVAPHREIVINGVTYYEYVDLTPQIPWDMRSNPTLEISLTLMFTDLGVYDQKKALKTKSVTPGVTAQQEPTPIQSGGGEEHLEKVFGKDNIKCEPYRPTFTARDMIVVPDSDFMRTPQEIEDLLMDATEPWEHSTLNLETIPEARLIIPSILASHIHRDGLSLSKAEEILDHIWDKRRGGRPVGERRKLSIETFALNYDYTLSGTKGSTATVATAIAEVNRKKQFRAAQAATFNLASFQNTPTTGLVPSCSFYSLASDLMQTKPPSPIPGQQDTFAAGAALFSDLHFKVSGVNQAPALVMRSDSSGQTLEAYTGTHWETLEPLAFGTYISTWLSRQTYLKFVKGTGGQSNTFEATKYPNTMAIANELYAQVLKTLPQRKEPHNHFLNATPETLNLNPQNLVSVINGVLDLSTGKLHPHSPNFVTRFCLNITYDPGVTDDMCPARQKFMRDCFTIVEQGYGDTLEQESIDLLEEFLGYTLSGRSNRQKFMSLHGVKRAGKGVTLDVVLKLFEGTRAVSATSPSAMITTHGTENWPRSRVIMMSDVKMPKNNAEACQQLLLEVTGGGYININPKNKALQSMKLPLVLWCGSNELLTFRDDAAALQARMLILTYRNSFYGKENVNLLDTLTTPLELSGWLNAAMRGLQRLDRNDRFTEPAAHGEMMEQVEDMSSSVSRFLRDMTVNDDHPLALTIAQKSTTQKIKDKSSKRYYRCYVSANELYQSYDAFCEQGKEQPVSARRFFESMKAVIPSVFKAKGDLGGAAGQGWAYMRVMLKGVQFNPAHPAENIFSAEGNPDGLPAQYDISPNKVINFPQQNQQKKTGDTSTNV